MRGRSLALRLRLVLVGLALVLAVVAAVGVAALLGARQDYEDDLARASRLEAAAARLLAAGVIEEAALGRTGPGARADRAAARLAYGRVAREAGGLAAGDPGSRRLLARATTAQRRARAAAAAARRGEAGGRFRRAVREARAASAALSGRQAVRREAARDRAGDRSRRAALVTGAAFVLALLAAAVAAAAVVATLRRPLDDLVGASGRLAAGERRVRVPEDGPAELRRLAGAFNAMAGDLEAALAALDRERDRLALTVESLGDALVVVGADGRVDTVNPRARTLLPDLVPGEVPPDGVLPPLAEALEGEVTLSAGERTLAVTAARLRGVEDTVWTARDVTERARLERLKTEFVATASHELRSPLTSIKGFVELLGLSPELDDRSREFLEIIHLNTNRLVDLVNDLLDVARVEAGQVEIHQRPTDLAEVVHEVVTLLGPRLADKRQELGLEVPDGLPPAYADPPRVRQVLVNLLTNAHLYTDPGRPIRVAVRAEPRALAVEVADTGRGMSPDELERVFDRFYRAADRGDVPGSGLGLSIVRSLVDLHGGSVEVDSEPGAGTTFVVRWPLVPAAVAADGAAATALDGRRVLVVEDEREIAQLIRERLAPYGVDTVLADGGAEAIARLREDDFDAVTLDVLMPGMSGLDVLREIRADPRLRFLPVVVVSVFSGRDALAGEWTVSKPIDSSELASVLGTAIRAGRACALVVARPDVAGPVGPELERMGIAFATARSPEEVARRCAATRYELALVDGGLPDLAAVLAAVDLRGRRLRRRIVVVDDHAPPEAAVLDAEHVPLERAADAVLAALTESPGGG